MLRYRLYDIDVVINKTLVYGGLTMVLALAYFIAVIALQALLPHAAAHSKLAVAGSTLAVAALFQPVRRRVQSFIDLRFYRRKYDAGRTIEAFATRLRDQVDLDALTADLLGVVDQTMQPATASLWLRPVGRITSGHEFRNVSQTSEA
jgi:hypothetical protein